MAHTFATIISRVQSAASARGHLNWQDGLNTRIRGALRSCIELSPPPFGEDEAAWETWVDRTTGRVHSLLDTAYELWEHGPIDEPWKLLAQ